MRVRVRSSLEFIPITSLVTKGSDSPGNGVGRNRVPLPDHGPLASTDGVVLHDAVALDTAVDMLDPQPTLVERLVSAVLLSCQFRAAGFLRRHEDRYLRQRERQEAEGLSQPALCRQGIRGRVGNALIDHVADLHFTPICTMLLTAAVDAMFDGSPKLIAIDEQPKH